MARKIRTIKIARAKLLEYDNDGKTTKKIKVDVRLCTGENPQGFEIILPDKSPQRHVSIQFSRHAIETILATNI